MDANTDFINGVYNTLYFIVVTLLLFWACVNELFVLICINQFVKCIMVFR